MHNVHCTYQEFEYYNFDATEVNVFSCCLFIFSEYVLVDESKVMFNFMSKKTQIEWRLTYMALNGTQVFFA